MDLKCPDCGEVFSGPAGAAGRARSKHRQEVHGYVPPPSKKKGQPSQPSSRRPESVAPPRGAPGSGRPSNPGPRTTSKVPSRSEWEKKLALTLGTISTVQVVGVVNRSRVEEAGKDQAVEDLVLDDDECEAIAIPFGGVIADGPLAGLNKKYGRQALDLLDCIPAVIAIVSYQSRLRNFQRQYGQPRQVRRAEPPATPQMNGANGASGPVEGAPAPTFEGVEFSVYGPGTA